jgi:hypothetical protein
MGVLDHALIEIKERLVVRAIEPVKQIRAALRLDMEQRT